MTPKSRQTNRRPTDREATDEEWKAFEKFRLSMCGLPNRTFDAEQFIFGYRAGYRAALLAETKERKGRNK